MGLNIEEKKIALQYIVNGADFMLIPSVELCNLIVNNSPETMGINGVLKQIILSKKPIRLDPETVKKYCLGNLDRKNTWLFDQSHIKVVPSQFKKPVNIKPKKEK